MEVQNIIATTDLGCQLNLNDIALKVPKAKYNPLKFAGLTLRIREPKATAQLFQNGKMVCLGTKTLADLDQAGREFVRFLTLLGYPAKFTSFTVCNMVGSADAKFRIDVENLSDENGGFFAPELFPALNYRLNNITFLIFHSGKVVATGAKKQEEIDDTYVNIYAMLEKYKK
jgi:transcription initiation factor TFIID TATA-box-binding protein